MRFPLRGRWEDADTGNVLVERLCVADTFWQRFVGLQLARPMAPDSGLLLVKCRSVHTFWMRFTIDVVLLSRDLDILELRTDVSPWRIVMPRAKHVAHIVELTAGHSRNFFVGQKTRVSAVLETTNSPGGKPNV